MHQKLRISDNSPLLDKLPAKLSSWSTTAISYVGRLQLLSYVAYGLINFWMTAFLLPKGCIKKSNLYAQDFCGQVMSQRSVKLRCFGMLCVGPRGKVD